MIHLLNIYPTLKEGKKTKEDNINFTKSTKLEPARKDDSPCKLCTDYYKRIANTHNTNERRRNYPTENKQKNNIKSNK